MKRISHVQRLCLGCDIEAHDNCRLNCPDFRKAHDKDMKNEKARILRKARAEARKTLGAIILLRCWE